MCACLIKPAGWRDPIRKTTKFPAKYLINYYQVSASSIKPDCWRDHIIQSVGEPIGKYPIDYSKVSLGRNQPYHWGSCIRKCAAIESILIFKNRRVSLIIAQIGV